MEITHYSNCDTDYVNAVKSCKTLDELKQIVTDYREIAEDAYTEVQKMDDLLFEQFCKGRNKSKPSIKWMEMYGAVLLPKTLLEIGLIAAEFHVPFGVAYIRCKEVLGRTEDIFPKIGEKKCQKKQRKRKQAEDSECR